LNDYLADLKKCDINSQFKKLVACYFLYAAEAPSYIDAPQRELKVAEGQKALLKCQVFGAPKPVLIWQKGVNLEDVRDIDRDHFNVLDNGNLEIAVSIKNQYHYTPVLKQNF